MYICKFGGSSVRNAAQIEKVYKIIIENPKRRFVVVSAPGKDDIYNQKITDHLFNISTEGRHLNSLKKPITAPQSKEAVIDKFSTLMKDLNIEDDNLINDLEKSLNAKIEKEKRNAYFASRGEHFNAKLVAMYFQLKGLKAETLLPEDIGFMVSEPFEDAKVLPETYQNIEKYRDFDKIGVIPGYYGITPNNDIAVFSRGGSDLTGGEFAYALKAKLYENWTDTNGIYQVDPRNISRAKVIPRLTYKEIRLLSSKGFDVFHFNAMVNCKKRNIPINIRNTNNHTHPGTLIYNERVPEELIAGIARLDNVAYIYLEKDTLGESGFFIKELFEIFRKFNITTYHFPTDKDDMAILLDQHDLTGKINDLRREIQEKLNPDTIRVQYDLSILSPVGIGMRNIPGVIAEAATALKNKNISIESIDQGPAQISFHITVASVNADTALEALYTALIEEQELKDFY